MAPSVDCKTGDRKRSPSGGAAGDKLSYYTSLVSRLLSEYAKAEQLYSSIIGTQFSDTKGLLSVKREAGELYRMVERLDGEVAAAVSRFCGDYGAVYKRLTEERVRLLEELERLQGELEEHKRVCTAPRTAEEAVLCIRLVERVRDKLSRLSESANSLSMQTARLQAVRSVGDTLAKLKSGVETLEELARNLNEILEAPLHLKVYYDSARKTLGLDVKLDVDTVLEQNKPVYSSTLAVLLKEASSIDPVLSMLVNGTNPLVSCYTIPQSIDQLLDTIRQCSATLSFIDRVLRGIRETLPSGNTVLIEPGRGLKDARDDAAANMQRYSKGVEIARDRVELTTTATYTLSGGQGMPYRLTVTYDTLWAQLVSDKLYRQIWNAVKGYIDKVAELTKEYNSIADEYNKILESTPKEAKTIYDKMAYLIFTMGEKVLTELDELRKKAEKVRKEVEELRIGS